MVSPPIFVLRFPSIVILFSFVSLCVVCMAIKSKQSKQRKRKKEMMGRAVKFKIHSSAGQSVQVVKGRLSREAHALASCENLKSVKLTFFKLNRQIQKWCPLGRVMVDKGETPVNIRDSRVNP